MSVCLFQRQKGAAPKVAAVMQPFTVSIVATCCWASVSAVTSSQNWLDDVTGI